MVNQGSYDLRRDVDKLKNKTTELSVDYVLRINSPVVFYKDQAYTPSTLTATSYSVSRDLTDFYDGKIVLQSTTDGNTYTNVREVSGHSMSVVIQTNNIVGYRFVLYDEEGNFLDRQTIPIIRSTKGQGYDFIYYTTEKESLAQSDYPTGDISKITGNFNEWLQSPKAIDSAHPNVFMSYRTSDDTGAWLNWSVPVKYNAIGEKGEDGEGLEMVFCQTQQPNGYSTDPSQISDAIVESDEYQQPDYLPTGWTDNQSGVDSIYQYEYMCLRVKEPNTEGVGKWKKFNQPKLWATYSEDGEDAVNVILGNEAQIIPVDSSGKLKSSLSFDIPVYCYKGTNMIGGTINTSLISSNFTVTKTNPSTSNNGNVKLTVKTVPTSSSGNEIIRITVDGKTYDKSFSWSKIGDGKDGNNGNTFDFVYCTTEGVPPVLNSSTKIWDNGNLDLTDVWCARPTEVTEQNPFCFIAYKELPSGTYSDVSLWANFSKDGVNGVNGKNGENGADGVGFEMIFCRTDANGKVMNQAGTSVIRNSIYDPSGLSPSQTDDYAPTSYGWFDNQGGVTPACPFEYVAIRRKTIGSNGKTASWGKFTTHKLWAKYSEDGDNGKDGRGEHYIYTRTSTNTPPSTPAKDVIIYNGDESDSGKSGQLWYEDPQGVTLDNQYEWVCKQSWDSSTSSFGNYTPPSLWNYYTFDGEKGDTGNKGKDGRDGTELTAEEIMQKIETQRIDAQSVGGINPSSILTNELTSKTYTDSDNYGHIYVTKQGNICNVTLENYRFKVVAINNYNSNPVLTLESWAKPIAPQYIASIPIEAGHRIRITNGGVMQLFTSTAVGTTIQLSGTFTYIVNSNEGLATTLTINESSVFIGDPVTATLKQGTTVLKQIPIVFTINGVGYGRQTNANGVASININLKPQNLPITATYNGNSQYNSSTATKTVTVKVANSPHITFHQTLAKALITNNNNNPIRGLNVITEINGVKNNQMTGSDGYVDFTNLVNAQSGNVNVKITTNDTSKCSTISDNETYASSRTSETITKKLKITSSNNAWNSANSGSLANKNDGAYAVTNVLSSGSTAPTLDLYFATDLPSTKAKIKYIKAEIRYASLLGWTSMSKGSYNQGESKIQLVRTDNVGYESKNFVYQTISRTQCGNWYDVGYQWDLNEVSNGKWNTPTLRISGVKNGGGGYGNNSRFGIDFVEIEIQYET